MNIKQSARNSFMLAGMTALLVSVATTPAVAHPHMSVPRSSITPISAGAFPIALAVDPGLHKLFVADAQDNVIRVVDEISRRVSGTVSGYSSMPLAMAIDPTSHKLYVSNQETNNVSVIDARTNTTLSTIEVNDPFKGTSDLPGIAVDRVGHVLYVTNRPAGDVLAFSTTSNRLVKTLHVKAGVNSITLAPDARTLYVTNDLANSVTFLTAATGSIAASFSTVASPSASTLDTQKRLFVASCVSKEVNVFNVQTRSLVTTVPLAASACTIAARIKKSQVIAGNFVINATTLKVVSSFSMGFPRAIAVDEGGPAFVGDIATGKTWVIP